jgi:hypothetical protein
MSAVRDWLIRALSPAGNVSTWSALAAIGESPLLRLTILVPFVGYLILFNDYVLSFFTASFDLIRRANETADASRPTLFRLNLFYFGALALGIASFLYTLFSPRDLGRHRSSVEYIQFVLPAETRTSVRRSIYKTIDGFGDVSAQKEFDYVPSLSYPREVQVAIFDLLHQSYGLLERSHGFEDPTNSIGYLDYKPMFKTLFIRAAAHKNLLEQFEETLKFLSKDVWFLDFQRRNYSRPIVRLLVMTLYAIGFALLFYPTVELTVRLIARLL